MSGFLVWYVLAVVTISDGKMTSTLYIEKDLEGCQHQAARVVAADPNARWHCHEMDTEAKGNVLTVQFP